jgi:hypothetical protein
MRMTRTLPLALVLTALTAACATTTRMPVTDIPAGNYVLVEPASDTYTAIAINDMAYSVRMDDDIWTGRHWVDADGQLHVVDDEGSCAGMESVWTYNYSGNRLTLDLVSDACTTRDQPDRLVYERHM